VASANIDEVIEDAVDINHAALKKYGIDLRYELADLPKIHMDKQRVLQILVNLITNAKQALAKSEKARKVLTIRSDRHGEDALRVDVVDNGIGISKEDMPRIFTHGFTTKKNGHGFGLHSSALAAREMGGSLTVHSDGPERGARFTLELPFKSAVVTKESRQS
jgi:C4-dicarboxylate-specific signal transduction histidine kinase